MQQPALWHDTRLEALKADVEACGKDGPKKIAGKLWPALSPISAASKLRDCLNPEREQKFSDAEEDMVIEIARAHGADFTMQFLARRHGYEFCRLDPDDAQARAKRARKIALLDELRRMEEEDEE